MFILFGLLLMLLALGAVDEMRYADDRQTSRPLAQQRSAVQVEATHRHGTARGWTR